MIWRQFVSCQAQDVLRQDLDEFSSANVVDLLKILTAEECRKVSVATLPDILGEISHKELAQKPKFVIDCWREITQPELHLNYTELTKMYNEFKPTPRKVVTQGWHRRKQMTPSTLKETSSIRKLNEEKMGHAVISTDVQYKHVNCTHLRKNHF